MILQEKDLKDIGEQICPQVVIADQIRIQVENKVWYQVWNKVETRVWHQVFREVDDQVWSKLF